jgi:hypothetical protein
MPPTRISVSVPERTLSPDAIRVHERPVARRKVANAPAGRHALEHRVDTGDRVVEGEGKVVRGRLADRDPFALQANAFPGAVHPDFQVVGHLASLPITAGSSIRNPPS